MKSLIESFPNQLKEAVEIAKNTGLSKTEKSIQNVIISGLGGSGIGGKIVSDVLKNHLTCPVLINNDYHLPSFVNKNTLVIISSYSGNTEETLSAMKQAIDKGAEVACITSGGKVEELAQKHNLNCIVIPGGNPPRACLGYSLVQQFRLLEFYGIHHSSYINELLSAVELIDKECEQIKLLAKEIAQDFHGKTPVIYAESGHEGLIIRLRQQLNENAKALCWHHVLPEMNHNELVGWGGGKSEYSVLLFRTDDDYQRTAIRMDISSEIISKKTKIREVKALGNNKIERTIYLIILGDWISWYLSELNGVDAIEINVINHLKGELAKI